MIRYLFALLLFCGTVPAHAQTGAALPSGYLSVSGNQIQSNLGVNVRLACASFRGAPNDGTMAAIRTMGQFNCIRIDWRDAYTAASTPTFDDEFNTTQSWLSHATWQTNDPFGFIIAGDQGGTAQGPTYWTNPIDTPSTASVYSNTGNALNLRLIKTPTGSGISQTTVGALINDQETPGGAGPLLFRYVTFSVAVPAVPGVLWQWDEEPADGTTEIDLDIWTDGSNIQHVKFWSQAGGQPVWYTTTSLDITQQNVFAIDWESNSITLYINGTQVAQTANPGGNYLTDPMFDYILTSDATYFALGPAPNTATLPATVNLDYFRVYPSNPNGGVVAPSGCNSLTQIDGCVANATSAGLAVVLNHIGNEAPVGANNPCIGRQQNGLWFDNNPSIGVTDDGCGDGGNYTYSAFKADTTALLQRYAGNSTVIGYQFHNDPIVLAGSGGGGGGTNQSACTAFPTANSCSLTQAQLNTLAANAFSEMLAEVPNGECVGLPGCPPLLSTDFLLGDTIITTAAGVVPPAGTQSVPLTDKDGTQWALISGQTCDSNPPNWWWGGLKINGVQRWCGYISALRLLGNGHVYVEASKGGGWWDLTQWQENGGDNCINDCGGPNQGGDPGPGPNNMISSGSSGGGGSSGSFTANNGQITDPNGVPWVGRGINVTIEDLAANNVTPATFQNLFPRANWIRVVNQFGGNGCAGGTGFCNPITPGSISSQVTAFTNLGIRLDFSDYAATNCGGDCGGGQGCRSGTDLANANAWYAQWAAFYKGNPFVAWETQNECQTPGWANQVETNYNAIRGACPTCQIVIGLADGNFQINYEINQTQLNAMTNVVFDGHPYLGNSPNWCSSSQTTCNNGLIAGLNVFKALSTNTETNIPMVFGEYGDSASGQGNCCDGFWPNNLNGVFATMSTGGSISTNNGSGAWTWWCPCGSTIGDTLTSGGSSPTIINDGGNFGVLYQNAVAAAPGNGPTPGGGGSGTPLVNWAGGGPTDIQAACSDVGAAVNAVNSGVIEFCPGPINNSATLLNGIAKP